MRWLAASVLFVGAAACVPLNEEAPATAPSTQASTTPASPPGPAGPYVLVPASASFAPLFPDELATLRKRVFELVAKQGVPLAKQEELDALEALSQSGRVRVEGPVCAAPTELQDLIVAKYGRVPQVHLRATCEGGPCKVYLDIARPPEGVGAWEYLDRFAADVEKPATVDGWLAALEKLAPAATSRGSDLADISLRAGVHPVHLDAVATLGDWKEALAVADFSTAQPALDACFESGWPTSGQDAIRLSYGADGTIQHCDVEAVEHHGAQSRVACLCNAVQIVRRPPGAEGRRVELRVTNAPRSGMDARGMHYAVRFDSVTASDQTEVRPQLGAGATAVSACAAAMGLQSALNLRVRLDVDPTGHVLGANTSATSDALRMCLIGNLRSLTLPCARSGTAYAVEGILNLSATPGH